MRSLRAALAKVRSSRTPGWLWSAAAADHGSVQGYTWIPMVCWANHRRPCLRLAIERLEERSMLAAGDLDLSFGFNGTGKQTYKFSSNTDEVGRAVAIQDDGKIVTAWTERGTNGISAFGLARFDPDGTPDSNFGGGDGFFAALNLATATDVAIQDDGKILAAGFYGPEDDCVVARLTSDGFADNGFSNNELSFSLSGLAFVDFGNNDRCYGIAIQPNGRIVVAGTTMTMVGGEAQFAVARLLPNGELDSDFDVDGKVITSFEDLGFSNASARDIVIQDNGRIVVGGYAVDPGDVGNLDRFAVARYNSDGTLDASFDGDGRVVTAFEAPGISLAFGQSLAIQSDGKIVLAGDATVDFAVVRYNTNGSLDASFGDSGRVLTDFAPGAATSSEVANSILIEPSGKIVVGGWTEHGGSGLNFALARYDSSGQLDTTFSNDGLAATDFGGGDDEAFGIALQGSKIVAVGRAGKDLALARYQGQPSIGPWVLQLDDAIASLFGSRSNDAIMVTDKGGGDMEFSSLDGRELVSLSGIQRVLIQGSDGDDTVIIRQQFATCSDPTIDCTGDYEYDGGSGADKLILETGPGRQIVEVNGDVPDRDVPDPHYSVYDELTGVTKEIFTTGLEMDTVDLGPGDDVLHVHWDPTMFADLTRFTVNGGAGDDDISFLFDQAFGPLERSEPLERSGPHVRTEPPLQIVVDGNNGDDSISAQFEHPAIDRWNPSELTLVKAVAWTGKGGPGNDELDIRHSAPGWFAVSAAVDMGAGADSVLLDWDGPTPSETGLSASELPAFSGQLSVKLGSGENQFQFSGKGSFATFGLAATGGIHGDDALISFDETTVSESLMTSLDLSNGANSAQWNVDRLDWNSQFIASYRGLNGPDQVGMAITNAEGGEGGLLVQKVDVGNGNNVVSMHNEAIDLRGGRSIAKIVGGSGMDDMAIVVIGGYLGTDAMQTWDINPGNGPNSVNLLVDDLVVDGKFTATVRDGTGASEVGAVIPGMQVGPTGVVAFNTILGNGNNTYLLQLEEFMVEGRATINIEDGTGAGDVTVNSIGGYVGPKAKLMLNTNLGNGINHYQQRSEGLVIDRGGVFETSVRGGTGQDDMTYEYLGGDVNGKLSVRMTDSMGMNTMRAAAIDTLLANDGELQFALTGGRNSDLVAALAQLDERSTGKAMITMRGGAGDDNLLADVLGADMVQVLNSLLDGGLGLDTCRAHSNVKVVNCER